MYWNNVENKFPRHPFPPHPQSVKRTATFARRNAPSFPQDRGNPEAKDGKLADATMPV